MSIQIFACDHRKNVQWDLPYIRIGGPESDCAIKCENKIFDINVNADETPKIFWIWKNLDQFGCDYIGYCQYRRFFTKVNVQAPIIDIPRDYFKKQYALTNDEQLNILKKYNADGILHPAFNVINKNIHPFTYIWEQIYILTQEKMLTTFFQKRAFDIFIENTPINLKNEVKESFKISENYLCNIFTTKKEIFNLFGKIAFNSIKQLFNELLNANVNLNEFHQYWLAYLFERYTSCFYHALEISKKFIFMKIPLMTIEANKHIKWRNNEI